MELKKQKFHDEQWFAKKEGIIAEPINNTLHYYRRAFYVAIIVYIAVLLITFDYYGSIKGVARFNGWLSSIPNAWLITLGVAVLWYALKALWLTLTIIRIKQDKPCTVFIVFYHIFSLPIFGLLAMEATQEYMTWAIVNVALYFLRFGLFFVVKKHVCDGFKCFYYLAKFEEQKGNYLDKARSVTLCGAPGTGKTVFGGTMAKVLAEQRWEKLQFDYFTESARKDYYIKTLNVEKLKRLKALQESYEFYKEREAYFIPCLVTSIGMRDLDGRYSYVLTDEVYAQLKRVPEYTVLFNDESGRKQGCNTSKTASEDVMDFWRLNRHFGDFILINTEQGADGNGKYIRKCTDYNIRCYYQEWILPPTKLQAKFEKQKRKFYKKVAKGKLTEEQQTYCLQELYYSAKYIATIGFRRIRAQKEITTEQNGKPITEDDKYKIIPSRTIYDYDDRAYAELYKCADEPIELSGWTSLTLNSSIVGDDTKGDVITTNA